MHIAAVILFSRGNNTNVCNSIIVGSIATTHGRGVHKKRIYRIRLDIPITMADTHMKEMSPEKFEKLNQEHAENEQTHHCIIPKQEQSLGGSDGTGIRNQNESDHQGTGFKPEAAKKTVEILERYMAICF